MEIIEIIKTIILGIVEGITEWLPISSTGHMLLIDEFIQLNGTEEFKSMFFYLIQLGAIFAVVVYFWKIMFPFEIKEKIKFKPEIFNLWLKVVVACIPGGIAAIFFDDYVESKLSSPIVIALALIFYGILFIIIENNKNKHYQIKRLNEMTYKLAFMVGLFQVLSIIPGTSRSGATIIGGLLIGLPRVVAAEFTFFLAVPAMLGMSLIKILKFGLVFSFSEIIILLTGMITAFIVSIFVIKFLMSYIKKRDFKVFGYYRIILGVLVLFYFI